MALLMCGHVNPISNSGVAISIEALWADGGEGDRVRTGPAGTQHNINTYLLSFCRPDDQ